MPRPKTEAWVTGPALETIKTLRAFQRGDRLKCGVCHRFHVFSQWESADDDVGMYVGVLDDDGMGGGAISLEDVVGWAPAIKEKG